MPKLQYGKEVIKSVMYDVRVMIEKGENSKKIQMLIIRRLKRLDNPSCNIVWD